MGWGSCTKDGVVTSAHELAENDESLQDFVIVHELLHLHPRPATSGSTSGPTSAHAPERRTCTPSVLTQAPDRRTYVSEPSSYTTLTSIRRLECDASPLIPDGLEEQLSSS